jgi:hypothetical protein
MNHKKKIAIIGGGIAGLTFARCLSSENHEIHIFEKKDQFGEIGAAISVFPNALCVMEKIGLLNHILESSGHFIKVYLKTDKGVILTETESKSDYPVVCIHRANLHSILLNDIDAFLHKDYALKSLTHQENGQINLEFINGEKMQFDAVVNNHHIIMDAVPEVGGEDKGPRPKELMLAALAGCTGIDVVSILQKMRVELDDFNIDIEADVLTNKPDRPPGFTQKL